MTHLEAIHIAREMMYYAVLLSLPALTLSLVVGLVIAVLQAATNIQEQTLTFVPRLLLLAVLFIVTMPWMLQLSVYFTAQMIWEAAKVGQ
ncbi:MAG: flagellar biosynthetic protein FliQ [Planctomycetota bacterium]|nr:flagellar biosynthetic protein FliQ [Planctomycetota bacterium]